MSIDPTRLAAASGLINAATKTPAATNLDGVSTIKKSGDVTDVFGLGKDDFFKLFLAQLRNQDPTQPLDDKEFIAQLAQFSLIDTMQQVSKSLGGTQLAQASALIGDQVIGTDTRGLPATGIVDRIVQDADGIILVLDNGALMEPSQVSQVSHVQATDTPATT
jgi:flagellar basal-body rod modification protein FlgD